MMNFEEIQQSWKSVSPGAGGHRPPATESLLNQIKKQQRVVIRSNVAVTIAFAATFSVFAWLFFAFHAQRGFLFSGSIFFMTALMMVYLFVMWKGVAFKKMDPTVTAPEFLSHYLKKLEWRKKLITTYTWIYGLLLWLTIMAYMLDVTEGTRPLMRIGAPLITTVYIVAVLFITRFTKGKKQLHNLNELITATQSALDNFNTK
jgi:hypothetical protein